MAQEKKARWFALAGAAALTISGSLASPALAAVQTGGYTVTVQAPGPGSPAGEIAAGTINGQGWQVIAHRHCAILSSTAACVTATGPALAGGSADTAALPDLIPFEKQNPLALLNQLFTPTQVQYGPVKANVAAVKLRMTNGAVLTLHPVNVFGTRGIAFAAPAGDTIVSATTYAANGRATYTAVPFGQPGQASVFNVWLKPGQHGLARASGVVASGHGWTVRGYVGPFGLCFANQGGTCTPAAPKRGAFVVLWVTNGSPSLAMGVTAPGVVRLVFLLPGGKTKQVPLVKIGGQKFFALTTPQNDNNLQWIAYYANGTKVPSS